MYNSLDTPVSAQTPGVARGACNSSAAGLASLVTGEVPQELYARPVDGPPEMAPNCEALISKAKATERELIRTPVIHDRESQFMLYSHQVILSYFTPGITISCRKEMYRASSTSRIPLYIRLIINYPHLSRSKMYGNPDNRKTGLFFRLDP